MKSSKSKSSPSRPLLIVDGNPEREGLARAVADLATWAVGHGYPLAFSKYMASTLKKAGIRGNGGVSVYKNFDELKRLMPSGKSGARTANGLLISLGGDGTLLHTIGNHLKCDLPVLGVNMGSVGFTASVSPERFIPTLIEWAEGRTVIEEHMVLRARLMRGRKVVHESVALNDVVLLREPRARIILVELHQGESRVLSCHADGIILATPTGSTAYNLSAGGPIVHPGLKVMIATLLNPHTLASRPVVLPVEPVVRLTWMSRSEQEHPGLMLDGRESLKVRDGDVVELLAHDRPLRLVKPAGDGLRDYFDTLRGKLGWNAPIRGV